MQKKWYIYIGLLLGIIYLIRVIMITVPFSSLVDIDEELMDKHFKGQSKTIKRLIECGFSPTSILDVGANIGQWTSDLSKIFKQSDFFMIEGNDKHIDKLKQTGYSFEIALVGDKIRNISYYKAVDEGDGTGNSIFKENSKFQFKSIEATLYPIDTIITKRSVGPFQMMKIDVQGAEVLALQGSVKTLETIEIIISEAGLMNYNDGAPTFFELFQTLDKLGYAMIDIVDIKKESTSGFVNQFDVFWLKKSSNLWTCTGYPKPKNFN